MNKDTYNAYIFGADAKYLDLTRVTTTVAASNQRSGTEVPMNFLYGSGQVGSYKIQDRIYELIPWDTSGQLNTEAGGARQGYVNGLYFTAGTNALYWQGTTNKVTDLDTVILASRRDSFETGLPSITPTNFVDTLVGLGIVSESGSGYTFLRPAMSTDGYGNSVPYSIANNYYSATNLKYNRISSRLYIIAAHEITAVTDIIVDGNTYAINQTTGEVDGGGVIKDLVVMTHYGTDDQKADLLLSAVAPHRVGIETKFPGIAYVHVIRPVSESFDRMHRNDKTTRTTDEVITGFIVDGKPVYDSRDSSTSNSSNPVIILQDFLTSSIGAELSATLIDTTSFEASADICDESVSLASGGTETRYTASVTFTSAQDTFTLINNILSSFGGSLYLIGDKLKLTAAKAYTSVATLTDADFVKPISFARGGSIDNIFNAVAGSYQQSTSELGYYPTVTNSTFLTEDGGISRIAEADFPYTTSQTAAQRLAKIYLNKKRLDRIYTFSLPLSKLALEPGDTITVTSTVTSLSSVKMVVLTSTISLYPEAVIEVSAIVLPDSTYNWSTSEEYSIENIVVETPSISATWTDNSSAEYHYSTAALTWTNPSTGSDITQPTLLDIRVYHPQHVGWSSLNPTLFGDSPSYADAYQYQYEDTYVATNLAGWADESVKTSILNNDFAGRLLIDSSDGSKTIYTGYGANGIPPLIFARYITDHGLTSDWVEINNRNV